MLRTTAINVSQDRPPLHCRDATAIPAFFSIRCRYDRGRVGLTCDGNPGAAGFAGESSGQGIQPTVNSKRM